MNSSNIKKEIDLKDILILIWSYKKFVISFTSIGIIISVLYSLSIQNTYISVAKLIPSGSDMSAQSTQFGGLAQLAGIQVSSKSSPSQEAIESMKSFKFFENNINNANKDIAAFLLAVKSWDDKDNKFIFNDSYDSNKKLWLTDKPSERKVFKVFESNFSITDEPGSPLVVISYKHVSPFFAKQMLDLIIHNINETSRSEDLIEAQKSIEYLNTQMPETNINEVKDVLSDLIKNQIQKIVLVKSNEDYIFKVLDPPFVPELKSGPNRAFICLAGAFISLMTSIVLLLLYSYYKDLKKIALSK